MSFDNWTTHGARITDPEVLVELRRILDDGSALIVEHRHYRAARAPHRFICDRPDALDEYLRQHSRPGDSFWVWRFDACCRDENSVSVGKVPDAEGKTPTGGAY